jgi:hypothetical protein
MLLKPGMSLRVCAMLALCGLIENHEEMHVKHTSKNTTPLQQNLYFLSPIITCHEGWIRRYGPQLKRQTSV